MGATFTVQLKTALDLVPEIETETLAEYPIFDEAYKDKLNKKIIDHFYNQEIGQESISMFQLALRRKMNEIMPLYNQHYVLNLLTIDPLSTMSIRSITEIDSNTKSTGASSSDTTGNSTSTSGSGAKSRTVASDTPQTQLNPTQDYASSMQDNISDSTATGAATETQAVKAAENQTAQQEGLTDNEVTGYQGHAPMLILQARQALVNVDMMVIEELQSLFMLIWSNNDEYTNNSSLNGGYRYGIY